MRVREVIRDLPASRIAEISALGMGDPAVIPLRLNRTRAPRARSPLFSAKDKMPVFRASISTSRNRPKFDSLKRALVLR